LEDLPNAGRAELKLVSCAVEKTAYCQIMAGIELGRRVAALSDKPVTRRITSSNEAIEFCLQHLRRVSHRLFGYKEPSGRYSPNHGGDTRR